VASGEVAENYVDDKWFFLGIGIIIGGYGVPGGSEKR
jgi:hypothetical protein